MNGVIQFFVPNDDMENMETMKELAFDEIMQGTDGSGKEFSKIASYIKSTLREELSSHGDYDENQVDYHQDILEEFLEDPENMFDYLTLQTDQMEQREITGGTVCFIPYTFDEEQFVQDYMQPHYEME